MQNEWRLVGLFAVGLAILGCSPGDVAPMDGIGERDPDISSVVPERTAAFCRDGKDNDGDGFVDCLDQDCGIFSFCRDSGVPDRPLPDAPAHDTSVADLQLPGVPDLFLPPDMPQIPDNQSAPDVAAPDAPVPDLISPDSVPPDTFTGDTGVPCKGHHDCPQKWFCYLSKCIKDPQMDVFHCGKPGCPPGHWCVDFMGKKKECKEDKTYKCIDTCDCGPAHCCKNGVCVKDLSDPWKPGGTAVGPACKNGMDPTYCCTQPECHAGKFASDVAARPFRCHSPSTGKALAACGGKPCFGTACNCKAGESCVDTSHGMPPGRTCLLLTGGSCVSNALAQSLYGFKSSDLLPCCGKGCLTGSMCEVGWQRSGGRYGYQRVVATCGSCNNGYCDKGEFPGTCPQDCKCGDGRCAPSEVGTACADCKTCGDGKCQAWESPATCAKDCSACGDSWCSGNETTVTCLQDCGSAGCPDAPTYPGTYRVCGDKHCSGSGCSDPETCLTCPQDCGPCEKGWKELSRTTGWMSNRLKAVWGASASAVYAVGSQGVVRYDGQRWGPMPSGAAGLEDVWGTSATDVWAVGKETIVHYDGKAWTRSHAIPGVTLYGVWSASPTEAFAVGQSGTILRYDGVKWSPIPQPAIRLFFDVWGSSPTDVFVVGVAKKGLPQQGLALHYNGATWSAMKLPTSKALNGLWGNSPTNVVAVGENGAVLRYDGTTWSLQATGHGTSFKAVWGASATDLFVVGHNTMLRHDGAKWTAMKPSGAQWGLWGSSATDVHLVGVYMDQGTGIHHFDGTKLEAVVVEDDDKHLAVWAASSTDVFVVGWCRYWMKIKHWNGTAWSTILGGGGDYLPAVWGSSPSDIYVGEFGVLWHYDGTQMSGVKTGFKNVAGGAIWGTSATDVVVGGVFGKIIRKVGSKWKLLKTGTKAYHSGIWGSSTSNVYLADSDGAVRKLVGTTVTVATPGIGKALTSVWGASATHVWAVGAAGTVLHHDGTSWNTQPSGSTGYLKGVSGTSATDVYVVGGTSPILRYDGKSWTRVRLELRQATSTGYSCPALNGVYGLPSGDVYMVGDHETVLQRCANGKCP